MRTINLLVVLHEEEWVEIKVAEKGDIRPEMAIRETMPAAARIRSLLHSPIVSVLG